MRWVYRLALTLAVIAPLHAPAFAAEPEAPAVLIRTTEAIRIAIQNRLSAKFTAASNARKSEQGALVEFYSAPEHHLLWVDDKEPTDRGKMVMAEIAKADDYGLRASDYALPKPDTFDASDPKATDWLADAEIKISFAVLGYANDARGGRKFTAASNARKSEQGALVEFYSAPEHHLLWVDDKELTDRGKMVMAEIAKADDYGLRASDYALPKR